MVAVAGRVAACHLVGQLLDLVHGLCEWIEGGRGREAMRFIIDALHQNTAM